MSKMKVKPVVQIQYDNRKVVAKYPSLSSASELTGLWPQHIGKVVNGLRGSHGGYRWKGLKSFRPYKNGIVAKHNNTVVAAFPNTEAAASVLGINESRIDSIIASGRKAKGGIIFERV